MIQSKTSSIQRALLGTLLAATAAMTNPTMAPSDMVTGWNEIAIQTFPPTVLGPTQARFLGIVHAAIYDAVNAIDRKHQVYAIDIKAPPGATMEAAAAKAAHDTPRLFDHTCGKSSSVSRSRSGVPGAGPCSCSIPRGGPDGERQHKVAGQR